MPEVIDSLLRLPVGAHCLSLHASEVEAAEHAVEFLAGTPEGQSASYWVSEPSLQAYYQERLAERAPAQVGCVHVLEGEQVEPSDGGLRPVLPVREFVGGHPEGVTGGADTISLYWTRDTVPAHLEYERWFDAQPRGNSRFLCPYDLRTVPADGAPEVLRALGQHHSHAVLSGSTEPAIRLLELFVFGRPADLPPGLRGTYLWARAEGLIEDGPEETELALSGDGTRIVEEWGRRVRVDLGPRGTRPSRPPAQPRPASGPAVSRESPGPG